MNFNRKMNTSRRALGGFVAAMTLAVAGETLVCAQTQPPPKRTTSRNTRPPRTTPPENQPAQPEQPQNQPTDPAAPAPQPSNQQPVTQPAGAEGQPREPVGRDESGKVRIDPEVQRKIDEMLQQDEAAKRAAGQGQPPASNQPPGAVVPPAGGENPQMPQPTPPAAGTPPGTNPEAAKTPAQRAAERRNRARAGADGANAPTQAGAQPVQPQPTDTGLPPVEPPGETTVLQIDPEPENTTPPEERQYSFSIKNGTYEQLIKGFAHQTGLGVLGEAPREGTVTFETRETLSFREALSRVRMLLFNYKPHEPYWIEHEGTHLRVIRVTDLYRILPSNRMFKSMEQFEAANLSDDEIVLVVYTPKTGSIGGLRQVRDFLPDYVRVTPLEDGNSVSIFALVSDIKKYMELKDFFPQGGNDPRITVRLDVHNINATEAVNRLRQLADLDNAGGGTTAPAARGPRGAAPREPSPLDQMRDPLVVMIPDDAQGYILVRGMQDKIDEIQQLLPFVDVHIAAETFAPVVVPVKYADAGDLINAIQQVLSASAAPAAAAPPPAGPSPRRNKKSAGGGPGAAVPVSAGDAITLLLHPTQNAILVMADEAGVNRVRDLVARFDVKSNIGPLRIQLEVADASEVVSTVTQVLGGGGGAKGAAPAAESYQLVPDPSGGSIWYSGTESDLETVRALVKELDVAGSAPTLHIVRLVYQQPSFVADILRQYDGVAPTSAAPAPAGDKPKTRRAVAKQSASKFTPDDPQKKLYILCNADDFARYQEQIAILDQPEPGKDLFTRVPLKHLESSAAVSKLGDIIPNTQMNQDVRMIGVDGAILLVGASPFDVQVFQSILEEIDRPSDVEQRTFIIKHADPADIKTAIEALVSTGSSEGRSSGIGSRRRGRPPVSSASAEGGAPKPAAPAPSADATVSDEMTIFQIGNKLVVKASPVVLDRVAAVVAEFDVVGAGSDLRVYTDFPPNSDIVAISETLSSVFAGTTAGARKSLKTPGAGGEGPRFIPQPNRLVVMADPTEFSEIERLLTVLKTDNITEQSIVEFIEVKHADPSVLVEEIRPLLDIKIRGLVESGEIVEPPAESTAPTTVPKAGRTRKLLQGSGGERYHIGADAHNERIVMAAPQRIIDEAKRLIAQFDVPASAKNIVMRTVEVVNSTPAEMVKAVKEMMGKPGGASSRRASAAGKPAVAGAAPAAPSPLEGLGGEGLVVMESPGGAAVLLRGTKVEVDQAEDWIHQLDSMSTRGRSIRLYTIENADLEQLFDLIVNVVDGGGGAKAGGGAVAPKRPGAVGALKAPEPDDDEEFSTTRTHASADTYINADLITDTMLVATTPTKLKQIDDLVKQFEEDEKLADSTKKPSVPKFTYKLEFHEDAYDAAYDLEKVLDKLWDSSDEMPQVEDLNDTTLIVTYPDKDKFDEIREIIREHVDKPSDKKEKIVRKSYLPPPGLNSRDVAVWIKQNHPDWDIELEDIGSGKVQDDFELERIPPLRGSNGTVDPRQKNNAKPNPGVKGRVDAAPVPGLPLVLRLTSHALLASALGQGQPEEQQEPPTEEHQPVHEQEIPEESPPVQPVPVDFGDQLIREAIRPMNQADPSKASSEKSSAATEKPKGPQKLKVYYDPIEGVFLLEGSEESLDEAEEWLDELKEEKENFRVKPDIRIYRVRYIDVFTAQDIIEEMFNATKAMQAQVQAQQNAAMQQQRMLQQQQMQQQRLQQQQQQQGRGQDGKDAQNRNQQQQQQQVPQMQMAQLPEPAVRVYPNPRDRTLILRAETSQYAQILELLATIDQPKPINSKTRTYQLKKVNAVEMEQMLREALKLDEAAAKGRGAARNPAAAGIPGASPGPSTSPGGALPETILQETFTGSLLGVDPQDITLFSSETANTIMAVAPPAALDYIGNLIEQFESGDIPERITRFYELKHASASDVSEQLEEYFAAKTPRGSGGRSSSRKSGGEGPAPAAASSAGGGLNAPSFIPYDRLNQITVHATPEQHDEIKGILDRLDVPSEEEAWKDVALAHADAKVVADTLNDMFGGNGAGGGATRLGKAAAAADRSGGGAGAKFIGESGGRIVFFSAPKARHPEILATIAKIEEKSKQSSSPRVIEIKNVNPSQVAEAIEKAYDPRRTGPQGGAAPKTPRFTVTAHDPSRRLFVVADDEMFAQIDSLIKTLDVPMPGGGMGVEFRIYPLQYASAKTVHGQMTKLMTEYVQRLGADAKKMEAFSVQPDETANALVVLGTPSVFGFIEENLRKIDTPAAKQTQQEVHVVELKNADPDALARALNEIFVRNAAKSPDGDSPITISAATGSRALMVRANAVDFARIQTAINQLDTELVTSSGEVRVVTILFGDASEIKTALESYLKKPAGSGGPASTQLVGDVRLAVMPQTNSIMISGEKETLDQLEGIAKGMDIAGEKGSIPQIIPLKFASASLVLPALKETFSDPKLGGGRKNYTPPVIVADEASNALIVRAAPQELAAIEGFVAQMDIEGKMDKSGPRIVQVAAGVNIETLAEQVQESINETAKARVANTKGATVPSIMAIPDQRTNTITLSGSPMLYDEAEAMIKKLEGLAPAGGKATAVISSKNVAVEDLQRLIEQLTQQQNSGRRGSSGSSGSRPSRTNR